MTKVKKLKQDCLSLKNIKKLQIGSLGKINSYVSIFLSIVILDNQKISEPEKKVIKKIDTKDISHLIFGKD